MMFIYIENYLVKHFNFPLLSLFVKNNKKQERRVEKKYSEHLEP